MLLLSLRHHRQSFRSPLFMVEDGSFPCAPQHFPLLYSGTPSFVRGYRDGLLVPQGGDNHDEASGDYIPYMNDAARLSSMASRLIIEIPLFVAHYTRIQLFLDANDDGVFPTISSMSV